MRPGVNAGNGPERGPDPVDDEELHGSVAAAAELEARGEDGVEVSAAGGEGGTDHAGGHEAVDGHGVLRLLHGDEPGAEPADERSDALDDGAVEDGDGEVGGADVVDGGVGPADVGLGDLDAPEDLNQAEHGHAAHHLGHGPDGGLLLGHVPLHAGLEVVVGTGGGVSPVLGPPDSGQEQVEGVGSQTVVIGD